jgi:hypothetical protein
MVAPFRSRSGAHPARKHWNTKMPEMESTKTRTAGNGIYRLSVRKWPLFLKN